MSIKLVIFDLDGVLVDAVQWHQEAFIEAINFYLPDRKLTEEYHNKELNGLPTKEKLRLLGVPSDLCKPIFDRKQNNTINIINSKCRIGYNQINLLNQLRSKNIIIGCYTNCIRSTARLMLMRSGASEYLDILLTNEDVVNCKPSPEGYIKIMNVFNSPPSQTVIVEDSDKGYKAAVGSKARTIRVKSTIDVNTNLLDNIYDIKFSK